jgi:hypothetical protein
MPYASCCLTQKSTSITGKGSAPLLLGPASYCALADSLCGWDGSGRMCDTTCPGGSIAYWRRCGRRRSLPAPVGGANDRSLALKVLIRAILDLRVLPLLR